MVVLRIARFFLVVAPGPTVSLCATESATPSFGGFPKAESVLVLPVDEESAPDAIMFHQQVVSTRKDAVTFPPFIRMARLM